MRGRGAIDLEQNVTCKKTHSEISTKFSIQTLINSSIPYLANMIVENSVEGKAVE